jgi:hypothetical protein
VDLSVKKPPSSDVPRRADPTFYTISDAGFFLGTVALLNSIRLTGHPYELVVLDCGFTEKQREILGAHTRLIPYDRSLISSPVYLKPSPELVESTGTVVIIDSDIVVMRSLESILDAAEGGRILAFTLGRPRWHPEWQALFDLPSAPRQHQAYVNSGFLALSVAYWPELLPHWWTLCQKLSARPFDRKVGREDPLKFPDQDILNALLMSEVPEDAISVLPKGLMGAGYTAGGKFLLHSMGGPKPWSPQLRSAVRKWRPAYVKMLRRCLVGPGVTVRVPRDELPPWLRPGPLGAVLERAVTGAESVRYRTVALRRAFRRGDS